MTSGPGPHTGIRYRGCLPDPVIETAQCLARIAVRSDRMGTHRLERSDIISCSLALSGGQPHQISWLEEFGTTRPLGNTGHVDDGADGALRIRQIRIVHTCRSHADETGSSGIGAESCPAAVNLLVELTGSTTFLPLSILTLGSAVD